MDAMRQDQANGTRPTLPQPRGLSRIEDIISGLKIEDEEPESPEAERMRIGARLVADLDRDCGERYRKSTFSAYATASAEQGQAKDALIAFVRHHRQQRQCAQGIVLFGPSGTGKDHLLIAAGRALCWVGISVRWISGMDLFARMRDLIGRNQDEETLVRSLSTPTVLILSDPLPPTGALTEFQASTLLRIVDRRYRNLRPTWATVNTKSRDEVESRMGAQVADRLRDGALCLYCNWPSYRKQVGV